MGMLAWQPPPPTTSGFARPCQLINTLFAASAATLAASHDERNEKQQKTLGSVRSDGHQTNHICELLTDGAVDISFRSPVSTLIMQSIYSICTFAGCMHCVGCLSQ